MSTTNNQSFRSSWKSILRPNRSTFSNLDLGHGFSTARSEKSPFIKFDQPLEYWRDVTSRTDMMNRWLAFLEPQQVKFDEPKLNDAVSRVIHVFYNHYSKYDMRVYDIDSAFENLPKNTSPGLPFKPGIKRGEVGNTLKRFAKLNWRRVINGERLIVAPCVAGSRRSLHPVGTNKPRLVFAYPAFINILESQFTQPFLEHPPPFLGWDYNWLDYGVSMDNLQSRVQTGGAWMNLDFSSFDSTVSAKLIRKAFDVVTAILDVDQDELAMLYELEEYFIHTPLLLYNQVRMKHRGIPSGSAFTQLIGSIVNMISCAYVEQQFLDINLLLDSSIWLGDDSCLVFSSCWGQTDMKTLFLEPFKQIGLKVNEDKTLFEFNKFNNTFSFLGHKRTFGRREWIVDIKKLPAQAVLPEFKDKCPDDAGQRLIGLVWAYGFDKEAYSLLLSMFIHLRKTGYTPSTTYTSKSMQRFMSIHCITKDMMHSFPSIREIRNRYYGCYTFLKMTSLHNTSAIYYQRTR